MKDLFYDSNTNAIYILNETLHYAYNNIERMLRLNISLKTIANIKIENEQILDEKVLHVLHALNNMNIIQEKDVFPNLNMERVYINNNSYYKYNLPNEYNLFQEEIQKIIKYYDYNTHYYHECIKILSKKIFDEKKLQSEQEIINLITECIIKNITFIKKIKDILDKHYFVDIERKILDLREIHDLLVKEKNLNNNKIEKYTKYLQSLDLNKIKHDLQNIK